MHALGSRWMLVKGHLHSDPEYVNLLPPTLWTGNREPVLA